MKAFVLAAAVILAVSLMAGCAGGGNQSSIQGLLDLECQKMVSDDMPGLVKLMTVYANNPELADTAAAYTSFGMAGVKVKSCSQKASSVQENGNNATATVEVTYEVEAFGQTSKMPMQTRQKSFTKIDGKWYDDG